MQNCRFVGQITASKQHRLAVAEKKHRIQVKVRVIQKEAEYLMKCGRYINAIESLNQILDFLSKFDLGRRKEFGDTMGPQTQLLLTTRAEAWLRLCKFEYALQGSFQLL